MRLRVLMLSLSAGLATVLGLTVAPATAATGTAAGPAPSIAVDVTSPQQVALDPAAMGLTVTWSASACPFGCELWRVAHLRSNDDQQLVDSRTFAAGSRQTFRVNDVLTTQPRLGWDYQYELRIYSDAAKTYSNPVAYGLEPLFASESAFSYGSGWRREVQLTSTETMIMRSSTPGAVGTLAPTGQERKVGIVSALGPQNGVMKIAVGGVVARTVDLHATSWKPRQVVAALDVPAHATLTVTNASPSNRVGKDVHLDGLLSLPVEPTTVATGHAVQRRRAADVATPRESIDARLASPQQVTSSGSLQLTVTAQVLGCPSGCSIVRRDEDADGGDGAQTVLSTRTSPASTTLQPFTATDRVAAGATVDYLLVKDGTEVALSGARGPRVQPDTAATYSYGWTRDASASAVGGSILRSSTPGTGATYQERTGTLEGRNVGLIAARGPHCGVMSVYVDGRFVRQIDLAAPTWQPARLVTAVDLPLTGRVTVVNTTPAARAGKDVHVDGFVLLEHPDDWY
jgi:hypothetical protein